MKIKSEFDLVNYGIIVEMIADGYFNYDGKYEPYLGTMNAMRIFWNNCVVESELDNQHQHNISNILDMQEIVKNEAFIVAFNEALMTNLIRFDFANAYADAMKMVDLRKCALSRFVDDVKGCLNGLVNFARELATPEDIEQLNSFATSVKDAEKLVTPENVELLKTLADSIKDGNSFESSMDKIIEFKSAKA